jgi:hypothetical protein
MLLIIRKAFLSGVVTALLGVAGTAWAAPTAVGIDGPGGGELAPYRAENTPQEIEGNSAAASQQAQRAVAYNGCVAPYTVVTYRITLPAFGSYLHRVIPDRRGFNVVMTIDYPGLFRRVNNWGPGQTEAFTVRTPNGRVTGRVKISGVGGSYGCYKLRITP